MKKCTKCLVEKPLDHFSNRAASKDGKMTQCKDCSNKSKKKYYQDNREVIAERNAKYRAGNRKEISEKRKPTSPEQGRKYAMKYRFGITQEQYDRMFVEQNGICAICENVSDNGQLLCIDHDHSCCPGRKTCGECIRGLLCTRCNMAIGQLRENVTYLENAIKYIQSFQNQSKE